jgi:hypothetical protein
MASIAGTLGRVRADLESYLPSKQIEAACLAVGHKWRERVFGPAVTLHLLLIQVLWSNTAMTHLRHLAGNVVAEAEKVTSTKCHKVRQIEEKRWMSPLQPPR